jgi:hypothetical protein
MTIEQHNRLGKEFLNQRKIQKNGTTICNND